VDTIEPVTNYAQHNTPSVINESSSSSSAVLRVANENEPAENMSIKAIDFHCLMLLNFGMSSA
jgi:hypothetical protein